MARQGPRYGVLCALVGLSLLSLALTGCCCCCSPGYRNYRPGPLFRRWNQGAILPRALTTPAPGLESTGTP